jgi:hypothetical protein
MRATTRSPRHCAGSAGSNAHSAACEGYRTLAPIRIPHRAEPLHGWAAPPDAGAPDGVAHHDTAASRRNPGMRDAIHNLELLCLLVRHSLYGYSRPERGG